ncbi:MAG TPA: pyruvate kinase, partial [Actinomycetes bacterium]
MRRAKIVCTMGPATSSEERVRQLIDAGMDVARLNLSHGSYADHEEVYRRVRRASDASRRGVGVLVDLQGPKIRLGEFGSGPVHLEAGDEFTITAEDVVGDASVVSTTYKGLPGDVSVGDKLLVDDGKVCLRAVAVEGPRVVTEVVEGGRVSDHKGINLPGVAVSVPALTDKDVEDLRWALRLRADLIALSFVRRPEDVDQVRAIMEEEGVRIPALAKIEKPQAVECLEEIVHAFDGIMVARGDLGVELPLEDVPLVQTRAIALARRAAKPVIVATQMLESMITSSRPTRAEASDVANAVLDGADALMLSGETSVGAHPIAAVETMARIIEKIEDNALSSIPPLAGKPRTKGGAITRAAAEVGQLLEAKYLVAFTQSGDSARRMSRLRSPIPLLAFTPEQAVRSQLALSWGIETFLTGYVRHTDEMVRQVDRLLLEAGRVE